MAIIIADPPGRSKRCQARANDLAEKTLRKLHRVMTRVLQTATRKGADARDMPRTWLMGNRDGDEPCPRCGGEIEDITVSGRRGWYCPRCQPGG